MRSCIKLAYDVTRYNLKNTNLYSDRVNKVIYTYSGNSFPVKSQKKEYIMDERVTEYIHPKITEYIHPKIIELEPIMMDDY